MKDRWYQFQKNHPKIAGWIYQFACFYLFSLLVTVFQYLVFTFMPYLLGINLAKTEFIWPGIPIEIAGVKFRWNLLGYEVARDASGKVIIGGGLGYFISYETGAFLAQCINFPLQRNITFKNNGRIGRQILWYFIAWILISLVCNGINGFWLPLAQHYFSPVVYNILVTFITGGVSMVIYFLVFRIIFSGGSNKEKSGKKEVMVVK